MEAQSTQSGQIIEISCGTSAESPTLTGNKICGGAACGFSDAETASRDAKERSAHARKLLMAVSLCIIFMGAEVAGGIKANSLAILTDAAHLLSDVAAFAISLFSLWASGWEATPSQSYGFFRIEILGALVSIQMIWLLTGILVYEAIDRIIHDTGEVQGFLMFLVATFGLVVNIVMAFLLGHDHDQGHGHCHGPHDDGHGDHIHEGHEHSQHDEGRHGHGSGISIVTHHHHSGSSKDKEDHNQVHTSFTRVVDVDSHEPLLGPSEEDRCRSEVALNGIKQKKRGNINLQGAYLHVLGDSIQSIGVMIGGAVIWYRPEWKIVDLICTLVFSVIVLATTIRMLRNILEVLMESTPREIDASRLEKGLCEVEGVVAVHELHIWAITVGKVLLACHVTVTRDANTDKVLDKVVDYIRKEYNISHITIHIERQ